MSAAAQALVVLELLSSISQLAWDRLMTTPAEEFMRTDPARCVSLPSFADVFANLHNTGQWQDLLICCLPAHKCLTSQTRVMP